MFKEAKAFSSFSINDVQKAKQFYGETLGLAMQEQEEGLSLTLGGGGTVFLYPKPNHEAATFTVLNFPVANIDEAVAELKKRGVQFEHYDTPHFKTGPDGIARGNEHAPTIAWFKDPSGNVISVIQS
ncbi:MAG TPA: VOC family protein [Thermoanaerobaculia bacterium]|nr:VOC family protein [Thermoanaerobaculia bacterium]